jgi:hypothetical protein
MNGVSLILKHEQDAKDIDEWWIAKDYEGYDRDVFQSIIS